MSEPHPIALIVEDDASIRRFVRLALEAEGWQVHEASTVRQGLVDAGTRRPELVIWTWACPMTMASTTCAICVPGRACR